MCLEIVGGEDEQDYGEQNCIQGGEVVEGKKWGQEQIGAVWQGYGCMMIIFIFCIVSSIN